MQATEILVNDPGVDHEYLPITGLPEFTSAAARLIFGKDSPAIAEERVTSVQTISGTGANHLGGLFLSKFYGWNEKRIYVSDPTWGTLHSVYASPLGRITPRHAGRGCGCAQHCVLTVGRRLGRLTVESQ